MLLRFLSSFLLFLCLGAPCVAQVVKVQAVSRNDRISFSGVCVKTTNKGSYILTVRHPIGSYVVCGKDRCYGWADVVKEQGRLALIFTHGLFPSVSLSTDDPSVGEELNVNAFAANGVLRVKRIGNSMILEGPRDRRYLGGNLVERDINGYTAGVLSGSVLSGQIGIPPSQIREFLRGTPAE